VVFLAVLCTECLKDSSAVFAGFASLISHVVYRLVVSCRDGIFVAIVSWYLVVFIAATRGLLTVSSPSKVDDG
jgi:hypothetical protein